MLEISGGSQLNLLHHLFGNAVTLFVIGSAGVMRYVFHTTGVLQLATVIAKHPLDGVGALKFPEMRSRLGSRLGDRRVGTEELRADIIDVETILMAFD